MFKLIHRPAALAVALLAACPAALAGEAHKNGMPCVAELCVGDGLAELEKLSWEPATDSFSPPDSPEYYTAQAKVDSDTMRQLRKQFHGDIAAAAPFLYQKKFDASAFPALARVSVACISSQLTGIYISPDGGPTRVWLSLTSLPGRAGEQRWKVLMIARAVAGQEGKGMYLTMPKGSWQPRRLKFPPSCEANVSVKIG